MGAKRACNIAAARQFVRAKGRRFAVVLQRIVVEFRLHANLAQPHYSALRFFPARDQAVAVAIPDAHGKLRRFRLIGVQPASRHPRFLLTLHHINKGGTCRGPCLETERARRMRRVCLRRRSFGGSILSSRGQRRRQTDNRRCETGRRGKPRRASLSGVLILHCAYSERTSPRLLWERERECASSPSLNRLTQRRC